MRLSTTQAHFLVGLVSGLLLAALIVRLRPARQEAALEHYERVRGFIDQAFVREVDSMKLMDEALHGMVESLDPYSRYYNEPEVADLERETKGRFAGFGLVLRRPNDQVRILYTLPGSPAEDSGLSVGDQILELDGEGVSDLDNESIQEILADEERLELTFRVRGRDGEVRECVAQRASLIDPTVRHVRIADAAHGIGYLAITAFSHETPSEFDRAFRFLEKREMRGLVIDLRRNLGGVLTAAVAVARRFVRGGTIVTTEGRGEPVRYEADESEAWYSGFPLVILVDRSSASASEVLAGALQDHRLAVLCGSPTYGKGMVQTIRHFDEPESVAKITTSYYYTPAHRSLERTANGERDFGILPDLLVELEKDQERPMHEHLASYSPPPAAIPLIEAWEEEESVELLEEPPVDAQLDAAMNLLKGRRPGPTSDVD